MSKTRDTGFLANVIQVHDTGVRIMSGSTMLMAVSSSGAVTITGVISGSDAANSLLLSGTGSVGFATTASFNAVSSSQQQVSASYIALSASYNTFSGSASTRITVDSASIQQVSSSQQQISASYTALSGSYNTFSGSASTRTTQIENVYATTGSNSFRANQSITGSLVVSSTITAQTLVVQTVTSSIVYSSGSNIFGSQLSDRQTFTGSVLITGSNHTIFGNVGIGTNVIDCYTGYSVLQAQGSSGAIIQTYDGSVKTALVSNSTGFGIVGTRTNHGLKIYTNDIERLHITNTGISIFACQVCVSSLTSCGIITANNNGAAESILQSVMSYADGYRSTLRLNNAHTGGNIWELYSTNNTDGVYSGGKLGFRNATTNVYAMTITCNGNVGIGTLSPTDCIVGGGTFIDISSTTGGGVKLHYSPLATYGELSLYKGSNGSYIDSAGASTLANNDLILRTGGTTNNFGVTERLRINSSGVKFQNGSSYLNYYCSADWAPAFYAGGTTSFGLTTQTGTGKFTRIGNVVILHGQISWTGAGSGGANLLSIQNLPFPAVCTARSGATPGLISGISNIASGGLNLVIEIGSCIIYLTTNCGNGGAHIHLTGDAVTSGGSKLFSFGGSYITNDAS